MSEGSNESRTHAEQCERLADTIDAPRLKSALKSLAKSWSDLADQQEKKQQARLEQKARLRSLTEELAS